MDLRLPNQIVALILIQQSDWSVKECEKRSAGGLMREGGVVFAGFYGTILQ